MFTEEEIALLQTCLDRVPFTGIVACARAVELFQKLQEMRTQDEHIATEEVVSE